MMRIFSDCLHFLRDIVHNRGILLSISRRELQSKYLGSYLGLFWAFAHPLITIVVLWIVFTIGFRIPPVHDAPFPLWLTGGIIPWFFFAEALNSGTNSITDKGFLIKNIVFRANLLPLASLLSSLFIHGIFLVTLFLLFSLYGFWPGWYSLQIIYYLFSLIVLLAGLNWITSCLMVFTKDTGQIVSIFLQLGFWLTPIIWDFSFVPNRYRWIFLLNPVHYIVRGYRETLLGQGWFWEQGWTTVYFWCLTLFFFVGGALLFRRLKPHFADVL